MSKDAYYFSHDSNARNDIKILNLRRVLGMEGYGIYFGIIETLREQKDFKLPLNSVNNLAFDFRTSEEKVKSVICGYDLFLIEDEEFFSARLLRTMNVLESKRKMLSEAGKRGNAKRWREQLPAAKLSPPDENSIALVSPPDSVAIASKVEYSKVDKIKEKENKLTTLNSLSEKEREDFLKKQSDLENELLLSQELAKKLKEEKEKKVAAKKEKEQSIENSMWGNGVLHFKCIEYHRNNPEKYKPEFYDEFLAYWTTPLDNGMERWQDAKKKAKEFYIPGRLATSFKLSKKFNNETASTSYNSSRIDRSNKRARDIEELKKFRGNNETKGFY